jgi:hypothetical protein
LSLSRLRLPLSQQRRGAAVSSPNVGKEPGTVSSCVFYSPKSNEKGTLPQFWSHPRAPICPSATSCPYLWPLRGRRRLTRRWGRGKAFRVTTVGKQVAGKFVPRQVCALSTGCVLDVYTFSVNYWSWYCATSFIYMHVVTAPRKLNLLPSTAINLGELADLWRIDQAMVQYIPLGEPIALP